MMDDAKEDLIEEVGAVIGRGLSSSQLELLSALVHPDVIEYTKRYVFERDITHRCQNYAYPWNCSKEASARYQNIKFGWLGGAAGIGFDESWCQNCRKKVLEEA